MVNFETMIHRLPALLFSLLFILSLSASAQWDDKDVLSADFHKGRREALRKLLPEKSVAVLFANPVRNRSNDVDYQYSQDPNFFYLTGYEEPEAVLLLFKEPRNLDGQEVNEVLFVQERNAKQETWTGSRLGVDGAKSKLGFKAVYNGADFKEFGLDFAKFEHIYAIYPTLPDKDATDTVDLSRLVEQFTEKIKGMDDKLSKGTLKKWMGQLREVKQPEEIALLQKAIDITCDGFKAMMRILHTGMMEYQAQSVVEYYMKKNGAEYEGYGSICGSGKNACTLHYTFNRKTVNDKELLLADIGGEYHHYTADITRTMPVNGKFTIEQKILYDLVREAQDSGLAVCKSGSSFRATHTATSSVIRKGLVQLGIIKDEKDFTKYFMHGTSHYLGLDVHDAGTFSSLQPGNVITVEPGIYIPAGSDCDPKWWNIGIRIEDDVLITKEGYTILTNSLPRTTKDIEKLMSEPSNFDPDLMNFRNPGK